MNATFRLAKAEDVAAVLQLLPRLAAFSIPEPRQPEDLWKHDAWLLDDWREGRAQNVRVHVADVDGVIAGVAIVSLQPEPLGKAPGAHLEVLAVADGFEGMGLGHRLIAVSEQDAMDNGASSMTLHVFANNTRARKLYERSGYDGELLRYIKWFSAES